MTQPRPLSYEDLRRLLLLIVAIVFGALLVRSLANILVLFTIVIFLAMVLNPVIAWLEKRKVKRALGVVLVMLGLTGAVVGAGFLIAPAIAEEINTLGKQIPTYRKNIESQLETVTKRYPALQRILFQQSQSGSAEKPSGQKDASSSKDRLSFDDLAPQLKEWMSSKGTDLGSQLLKTALATLGGVFTFIIAILLTTFILLDPKPLVAGFLAVVPERHRDAAGRSLARISTQMVAWIRATLINGAITGVSTGLLLHFLGVQPALVFGILSFFGEFVPNLGPLIASVPALFVAAGMGTEKFLLTGAVYLFVQQVESSILVPFIMGKEMELHPVTIVFFALAMGALFGIAGAILAVPVAAVVKVLVDEFYFKPNNVPLAQIEENAQKIIVDREWPETSTEMS